ncbi:hypothetical protein B0H67DRAFT_52796 [Lasiosphaeris hirsuta]|uniref:Secreted protein n=1 Tax=Lasiosphaeris hirsuta TaxID=260670 RepID=A0AA40BAW0_9PEZI|nr:hypothetical protein B0H67DRAFT_52796 [Lasiosphaeris hirsuta]
MPYQRWMLVFFFCSICSADPSRVGCSDGSSSSSHAWQLSHPSTTVRLLLTRWAAKRLRHPRWNIPESVSYASTPPQFCACSLFILS